MSEPSRPGLAIDEEERVNLKIDRLLNVEQVRERLQCSRKHVYNLINSGELAALKIGEKHGIRVRNSALQVFIENREADSMVDFL